MVRGVSENYPLFDRFFTFLSLVVHRRRVFVFSPFLLMVLFVLRKVAGKLRISFGSQTSITSQSFEKIFRNRKPELQNSRELHRQTNVRHESRTPKFRRFLRTRFFKVPFSQNGFCRLSLTESAVFPVGRRFHFASGAARY